MRYNVFSICKSSIIHYELIRVFLQIKTSLPLLSKNKILVYLATTKEVFGWTGSDVASGSLWGILSGVVYNQLSCLSSPISWCAPSLTSLAVYAWLQPYHSATLSSLPSCCVHFSSCVAPSVLMLSCWLQRLRSSPQPWPHSTSGCSCAR